MKNKQQKQKVSHLRVLYTDDLKVIGRTEEKLQKQMKAVRICSDDIHMEFGLNKCAKFVLKERKTSSLTKFKTSLQQRNTLSSNRQKHKST
jgi:predicted RNA binding protein with dsRBD fold (UPF0201 family)